MRYLNTFGLIVLTMTLWNPGASCAAQIGPPGSYLQTCRNIGTNGSDLYATCQNSNGEWQSTQLQGFQRCGGEIGNSNGTLRCDIHLSNFQPVSQDDRRHGQPRGAYEQTCQDIRINGSTLEANCQTRDNNRNRTSLQNFSQCTGGIENNDGRLECSKGGNGYQQVERHDSGQADKRNDGSGKRRDKDYKPADRDNGAPYGTYTQTCQDVRTTGTTLQANCQKKNGKWKQSSLHNFNRCNSIENVNGKLVCNR
jgi:hypothetical protein